MTIIGKAGDFQEAIAGGNQETDGLLSDQASAFAANSIFTEGHIDEKRGDLRYSSKASSSVQ